MGLEVMKDQLKVEGQEERRTKVQEVAHPEGSDRLDWRP